MMGRLNHDQGEFFYSFRLDDAVPDDHPVRAIAAVLDLILGTRRASALLSEDWAAFDRSGADDPDAHRRLRICDPLGASVVSRDASEPAYRWFCGLSIEDKIPDHFSILTHPPCERFRESDMFRRVFERVVEARIAAGLVGGEGFAVDASLIVVDANKQRSIPGTEWKKIRSAGDREPRHEGVSGDS